MRQTISKDRFHPRHIPLCRLTDGKWLCRAAQIHRTFVAQRQKPRMHLGNKGPRRGACHDIIRPDGKLGMPFSQIFGDGHALPDGQFAGLIDKAGNFPGW